MNFHNDVNFADVKTGEVSFEIKINEEQFNQILPTSNTTRHFNGQFHNFEENEVQMSILASLTNRSQILHDVKIDIPARSTINFSYEFNSIGISDIDAVIEDIEGNLQNPYFILGSNELRPASGLASGKLIFEVDSNENLDTRAIQYTLVDNDLLLDLEADNISNKQFRLKITNCYLYNGDRKNLLDLEEILQLAFFPGDCVNLKIRICADGTVTCQFERI